MGRKHFFSAHTDLKTGLLCKVSLISGCFLFLLYVVEAAAHPLQLEDDTTGIVLAFSILFLGLGLILFFFSCQFAKLSKIAEEVENDETLLDEEEKET
jgi:hypothetical protein